MAAKWECAKCLFDNEASISFCQLCGHHASIELLHIHLEHLEMEIADLKRNIDASPENKQKLEEGVEKQQKLQGIIQVAELEARRQKEQEAKDDMKGRQQGGRPWPSLEDTFEDLADSISTEMDADAPTFTYSWSEPSADSAATNGAPAGLRPQLRSLVSINNNQQEAPEQTFPKMSHSTVVKRITSYEDKSAIRAMLKYYDDRTIAHCLIEHEDPGGQYWALDGVDPKRKKRHMLPPFGWSTHEKRALAMLVPAEDRWSTLMECGEFFMKFGNAEDAESMLEGALFVAECQWPATHRSVGQTCNSLGWLRMRQSDFHGAIDLFKRAYEVYEKLEYPLPNAVKTVGNHPMCSSILQTMARIKAMIAAANDHSVVHRGK